MVEPRYDKWMKISRSSMLLVAFALGFTFPQVRELIWLIPWTVRIMIFSVFIGTNFKNIKLRPSNCYLLAINLTLGIALTVFFRALGNETLAQVSYFTATAPTATAAPAVMLFLGGKVEYVLTSFILTTVFIALSLPFILPWAVNHSAPDAIWQVFANTATTIFIPIVLALIIRMIVPRSIHWSKKVQTPLFCLWVAMIMIICASASHYLRQTPELTWWEVAKIAVLSQFICFLNFALGYLVGEKGYQRESSQSLGQKNTSVAIFLATTYSSPLVALGPTLYTIWHNLWNAWQLSRVKEK